MEFDPPFDPFKNTFDNNAMSTDDELFEDGFFVDDAESSD